MITIGIRSWEDCLLAQLIDSFNMLKIPCFGTRITQTPRPNQIFVSLGFMILRMKRFSRSVNCLSVIDFIFTCNLTPPQTTSFSKK